MTVELWVEVAAVGLAIYATWLSLPRSPRLAWERLWKVGLSVITAGEVERAHGTADAAARKAWEERVVGVIPWHPAGRDAERKLREPRLEEVIVPALDGERALVEDLAALPDATARFRRMYVDDPRALEELLGDPAVLGPDHDPAAVLGPDAGWDAVAAWSAPLQTVLLRRLGDLVVVCDGLPSPLVAALGQALPGLRLVELPPASPDATDAAGVAGLFEQVESALQHDADRVVLIAWGSAIQRVLLSLSEGAGLRDRTQAVVSLGGHIQVPAFQGWLDQHFTHDAFDTELRRSIPFISVVDVDPADPLARPWEAQRFPLPPPTPQGRAPIEPLDLGPLQLSAVAPSVLARGILLFLAMRLVSQG